MLPRAQGQPLTFEGFRRNLEGFQFTPRIDHDESHYCSCEALPPCVPNRGGIRPVTEMIQGYAVAMTLEAAEADLFATVFPHPTISEGMHEAALDAFGRALHS